MESMQVLAIYESAKIQSNEEYVNIIIKPHLSRSKKEMRCTTKICQRFEKVMEV
jgi:hypothetical protein